MRKIVYSADELVDVLGIRRSDALRAHLYEGSNERLRVILSEIIDDLSVIVGKQNAGKWLRASNDAFEGACALDVIELGMSGAERVQEYVKSVATNPW